MDLNVKTNHTLNNYIWKLNAKLSSLLSWILLSFMKFAESKSVVYFDQRKTNNNNNNTGDTWNGSLLSAFRPFRSVLPKRFHMICLRIMSLEVLWGRCQILTGCNVTKAITSSVPQRCNGVFTLAEKETKTDASMLMKEVFTLNLDCDWCKFRLALHKFYRYRSRSRH